MKRRLALLVAAAMLGTISMLAPASPASATVNPDVCAGTGNAALSGGLGYPGLFPSRLVNFFFGFTVGACAVKGGITATGHVHGWCGHSTGSGVTNNGAHFHTISAGGILLIVGHLVGVVNAVPDPAAGSCLSGTATSFLITGLVVLQGAVLTDCSTLLSPIWQCL